MTTSVSSVTMTSAATSTNSTTDMVDVPSSAHEAAICAELRELSTRSRQTWARHYGVYLGKLLLHTMLLHNKAALFTSCLLFAAYNIKVRSGDTTRDELLSFAVCFTLLYSGYGAVRAFLLYRRMNETSSDTLAVMDAVQRRWASRIAAMPQRPPQSVREWWAMLRESFMLLPARAFRTVAVVDDRTQRLKLMPKSLVVKHARRLNAATLRSQDYAEPHGLCKLIDAMQTILKGDAIVLKPLPDRAKPPPRLPNLRLSVAATETQTEWITDEESSTDESDAECEPRTALGGGNSITVAQHMEYFVHRVLLLLWGVGMIVAVGLPILHAWMAQRPTIDAAQLWAPAVALVGLLPMNALVLQRLLVLYANVYLDKLFHFIVAKRNHSVEDRLPRFSTRATLRTVASILLGRQPSHGSRNPRVFAASLVDAFGMATVVAMLDQVGIVTDMVQLPMRVLVLRARQPQHDLTAFTSSSSSSSDEEDESDSSQTHGERVAPRDEAAAAERANRLRQRRVRHQIRRKKLQEERFREIALTASTRDTMAVEWVDEKDLSRHQGHLYPLCLCALLHACAPEPILCELWTEPFRFVDRTLRWGRAMHWLPRLCGFSDKHASSFLPLARIVQLDTRPPKSAHCVPCSHHKHHHHHHNHNNKKKGATTSSTDTMNATTWSGTLEQACSWLMEDRDGGLHVFTIGTPYLVCQQCSLQWTGDTVTVFTAEERAEVVRLARAKWGESMGLESVACAHRLLPERYRRYVTRHIARDEALRGPPQEYFFRDGQAVTGQPTSTHSDNITKRTRKVRRTRSCESRRTSASPTHHSGRVRAASHRSSSSPHHHYHHNSHQDNGVGRRASSLDTKRHSCHTHHHHHHKRRRTSSKVRRTRQSDTETSESDNDEEYDDAALTEANFVRCMVQHGHTLLGLVGLQDGVRPNVQAAMSLLDQAGVRCMYFCAENERRAKSFGGRVGLETDWNCCISLKDDAVALDPYSIRAQMPFGIKAIRRHLLHVDPIPLQVNLFAHAHGGSTRAMLSVLQDNHEVVLGVGSVLNHSNVRSFVQADLAIGALPTRRGPNADKEEACLHSSHTPPSPRRRVIEPSDLGAASSTVNSSSTATAIARDLPLYRNVAELLGCSCALHAPPTTSLLPVLATMVRQARLRLSGISNCVEFVLHASALVVIVQLLSMAMLRVFPSPVWTGVPQRDNTSPAHISTPHLLLSPLTTLFELHVIIPLLALSCTYTAYSGLDPMKTIPTKHNFLVRCAIFRHGVAVWCVRYVPSVIALLALSCTVAHALCPSTHHSSSNTHGHSLTTKAAGVVLSRRGKGNTTAHICLPESSRLLIIQAYSTLTLNYWLMVHCSTHMSRHHPISLGFSLRLGHGKRSTYLFRSFRWLWVNVVAAVIVLVYVLLRTPHSLWAYAVWPSNLHALLSWFVMPCVLFALDWPLKKWRERRFSDRQKFRRLFYGTRLGMHSPRGDYEPESMSSGGGGNISSTGSAMHEDNAEAWGEGGAYGVEAAPVTLSKRIAECFFRYTTVRNGKLEMNCACCDHIGGPCASYNAVS